MKETESSADTLNLQKSDKMEISKKILILVWGLLLVLPLSIRAQTLNELFMNPPDSIRPYVYWYWLNDHINTAGIEKDLEAMKAVGIGGAFIGNIGLGRNEGTSFGTTKFFSSAWWDAVKAAAKHGDELGLTLGLFNGPGWTQSGGPWVEETDAMCYLAVDTFWVNGKGKPQRKVFSASGNGRLQYALAARAPANHRFSLAKVNAKATFRDNGRQISLDKLVDGNFETAELLPAGRDSLSIDVHLKSAVTANSLVIHAGSKPFKAKVELRARADSGLVPVKTFYIDRSNAKLNVGFMPNPPIVIVFDTLTSAYFNLMITDITGNCSFREINITPAAYIERFPEKQLAKMFQSFLPTWDSYRWSEQPEPVDKNSVMHSSEMITLERTAPDRNEIEWEVPAGDWMVMLFSLKTTGVTNAPASEEAQGREVDKLDGEKLVKHFDAFVGRILDSIPEKNPVRYVVADSYETGSQNWTDQMVPAFESRYGYDPLPWLPTLAGFVVESRDKSDRFLWDLRRLVADLIAYEYVGGLRKLSNGKGMRLWLENYGHWGFPSESLTYGGQADEVAGEFWNEGDLGNVENKLASSAAHVYGKNRVWAESYTAGGKTFERYPALLKRRGDWSYTEGINQTLLHLYIHQPDDDPGPGINAWFGTEFNRKNTWFSLADGFIDYIRRNNFMLQQGVSVNDIAYFMGEDAPLMTGIQVPERPAGYDYDYINADAILNKVSVEQGYIVLPHGAKYRLLVLPPSTTMTPEVLEKIDNLIEQGAAVYGNAPERSPSLAGFPIADNRIRMLASKWQDSPEIYKGIKRIGKGILIDSIPLREALAYLELAEDCLVSHPAILYAHRRTSAGESYFLTNQSDSTLVFEASFRVDSASPGWWNPVDGRTRDLPVYSQAGGRTIVPIKLAPYESGYIYFDHKKTGRATQPLNSGDASLNFPPVNWLLDLNNDWTVSFSSRYPNAPAGDFVFDDLIPWEQHKDERVKSYSGIAHYKKTVFWRNPKKDDARVVLGIGALQGIARVRINGDTVGTIWTAPWQIDITDAISPGKNTVELEVASTWVNHLTNRNTLPEIQKTAVEFLKFGDNRDERTSGLTKGVRMGEYQEIKP